MPTNEVEPYLDGSERRRFAEQQVRAKFPSLIEGSIGWHRAVANRIKRSHP